MRLAILILATVLLTAPSHAQSQTRSWLGDWGHYLTYAPVMHLHNPDGQAFTITLGVMRWPIADWNPDTLYVQLASPEGQVLIEGEQGIGDDAQVMLAVPDGEAGVYTLRVNRFKGNSPQGPPFLVQTTLPGAVVWTGTGDENAIEKQWLVTQPSAPRRWWFFVPRGVKQFTIKAQRSDRFMSQREDWGLSVITPRGQRTAVLWGQPAVDHRDADGKPQYRATMSQVVEVEPGNSGRFWSVEVRLGDSHNYSNINLSLEGVPPYVAVKPEAWFDPDTGKPADVVVYDDDPFIQSARTERMDEWPQLQHFSPSPALGDPEGNEMLGDATFVMANPERRTLQFRIGTYLPRHLRTDRAPDNVQVTATPRGQSPESRSFPMEHLHGKHGSPLDWPALATGEQIRMQVEGAPRWFAYTYPAVPTVLVGRDMPEGWSQFKLSVGSRRNWYFRVPAGAKQVQVRIASEVEGEHIEAHINAPDRTMAMVFGQSGAAIIDVPPGLDDCIWHLRLDIAGSTQFLPDGDGGEYLDVEADIQLKGVEPYLSPTWSQWFKPASPRGD